MKRTTGKRSFLADVRRRGVLHVCGLYILTGWVVVQVADTVLSEEAVGLIWIALILGFPIAAIFGWRYDITRDGVQRTDPDEPDGELPLGRLDYGIISTLSLVLVAIAGVTALEIRDLPTEEMRLPDGPPAANSIAVLLFESCDADPDVEVLGAALAAQLIEWLSATEGMKVIARTSAFAFRASMFEIRRISEPLHVAHLLTGTLCREGNQLRLDAELVDPEGFVLASRTFYQADDPGLPQAETLIAAVAEWTTGELGLTGPAVVDRTCENLGAFQQTLIGREHLRTAEFEKALIAFERALDEDSSCVDAIAGIALARIGWRGWRPVDHMTLLAEEEPAVRRAVALAPTSEFAADALAILLIQQHQTEEAEEFLRSALVHQPRSALLHTRLAHVLAELGSLEEAEAMAERALVLDPTSAEARIWLGVSLGRRNRMSERIRVLLDGFERDPLNGMLLKDLAWAYYGTGQFHQADRVFERLHTLPDFPPDAWRDQFLITLWSGRTDRAIAQAIDMLEHGGEDLAVDYVHRELCYAAINLGVRLGLNDAMNQWMEQLGRVPGERQQHTWREFEMYRLLALGDSDGAAQAALSWFEDIGGVNAAASPVVGHMLATLVRTGRFERAMEIIEASGRTDYYATGRGAWIRAMALYGLGREAEADDAVREVFVSGIEDQEERLFGDGWRSPNQFYDLAFNLALAGRPDEALDALEMAVDAHFRGRLRPLENETEFEAWTALFEYPRFLELEEIVEDDLARQARRVRIMLEAREGELLFAQLHAANKDQVAPGTAAR